MICTERIAQIYVCGRNICVEVICNPLVFLAVSRSLLLLVRLQQLPSCHDDRRCESSEKISDWRRHLLLAYSAHFNSLISPFSVCFLFLERTCRVLCKFILLCSLSSFPFLSFWAPSNFRKASLPTVSHSTTRVSRRKPTTSYTVTFPASNTEKAR